MRGTWLDDNHPAVIAADIGHGCAVRIHLLVEVLGGNPLCQARWPLSRLLPLRWNRLRLRDNLCGSRLGLLSLLLWNFGSTERV